MPNLRRQAKLGISRTGVSSRAEYQAEAGRKTMKTFTKIKRYDWRKDPEAVMIPLRRAVAWRKWQERASHQPPFEYGHRTEK